MWPLAIFTKWLHLFNRVAALTGFSCKKMCLGGLPGEKTGHGNKATVFNQLTTTWGSTLIDQFRYIKIQSQTIDLRTRLWGINPTNSVFITQSLVLRSIV